MKKIVRIREKWQGLSDTVIRFPLTILLLVAAVTSNAMDIETGASIVYSRWFITLILGAAFYAVLQLLFERFFDHPLIRLLFMVLSLAVASLYYISIREADWDVKVTVRTVVIFFFLLIAFLWIPVICSIYNFNESFMAVFKAFFTALLFSAVLFLGIVLTIGAMNLLLIPIDTKTYLHAANIIFVLIAPTHLLTMLPVYPGMQKLLREAPKEGADDGQVLHDHSDKIRKMITPARFLEALISYIIIPITVVFTVILLLYIIVNIRGEFWTDSLMEPLLVAYSITVIIVYLLSSTISNPFSKAFRRIFPKVLIPIVLFQTISSLLKVKDAGITYGRYYVILFGIFATVAGILFSFLPVHKNGIIAPILMALALVSILPPVDAFSISKANQIYRLEAALERNGMLVEDTILPKSDVSEADQTDIIKAVDYIVRLDYDDQLPYLASYRQSRDFDKTFGFSQYGNTDQEYQSFYYSRDINDPILITGYDAMLQMNVYGAVSDLVSNRFIIDGENYIVRFEPSGSENQKLILENIEGKELLQYELKELYQSFTATEGKAVFPTKEMTFSKENDMAELTLVANSISRSEGPQGKDQSAEMLVLIKIK